MEEKSKVEQFEEGLEELFNAGKISFEPHYSDVDEALKLMESLNPTKDEKYEMEDKLSDLEDDAISAYWDEVEKKLLKTVSRYGGDTSVVSECVDYYRREGGPEDSAVREIKEFNTLDDSDNIYWNFYFRFFPDSKVPEGLSIVEYLHEQRQLRGSRDLAAAAISSFLCGVAERVVQLRFGEEISRNDFGNIYYANDFDSFYPEFVEEFKKASTATKEEAKEIRAHYWAMGTKIKSTARRLLKVTPELVVPMGMKVGGQN